jgi:hypothetical protein
MKLLYFFSALLCLNAAIAQNSKTFNKGEVAQKNYNASVPYKDINGLAIVEVSIKGKSYNFIVDTGALTAISQELYEEFGLKSETSINVSDSSELSQNMKIVTLPPVEVGGIAFKEVPAVVADNSFFFQCLGIDGFIGSNMMRNSVVKFSYKDKTVTFTDKLKNFSTDKKQSAGLAKDKFQSNPYLKVMLKGDGYEIIEYLLFDTGMVGLYDLSLTVHESTLKQPGIYNILHHAKGAFSLGIHGVENQTEHFMLSIPELHFAGTTFKNVTTTTTADNRSRIGSEILKYGEVIVDYPHRKLYFNPYSNGPVDVAEKNWPVQPVIKDDKFVVGIVWDTAFNDRVNQGDEILKFGEIDFAGMQACDALRLDIKPATDTATMVLKDVKTGEIKNVELTKQ